MKFRTLGALPLAVTPLILLSACGGAEEAIEEEPVAEVEPLADACPDRVLDMRGSTDPFTCSCSAESAEAGTVWGTGPYSDDSAVCRAAMHAGLVGDEPANVTLNFLPGRESYSASTQNGVETRTWGNWSGSYGFEGVAFNETEEKAELDPCPSNASEYRDTDVMIECACTAEAASSGPVWGTGTYTDDSRVCRAALHAGVIGPDGGDVGFTPTDGQESYQGSTQNGVDSNDYGRWSGSIAFGSE
jgi:hypothetical protein